MLDLAFLERYGPVRVVVTYRSGYEKSRRQRGVHDHGGAGVQVTHEVALVLGVGEYVVVNVVGSLHRLTEIFLRLVLGEDVHGVRVARRVVGNVLHKHGRLLLIHQARGLLHEVFRARAVLAEHGFVDALQDTSHGRAGKLRLSGQLVVGFLTY